MFAESVEVVSTVSDKLNLYAHLAKTHFISKNTIEAILVQTDHPLDTCKLVVSEFSTSNELGLFEGILNVSVVFLFPVLFILDILNLF